MVVVSNTSPISNLAIVGRLALLRDQFGTVLVPSAVRQGLRKEARFFVARPLERELIAAAGEIPD
jgi:predicted nucleic acid-binding protein